MRKTAIGLCASLVLLMSCNKVQLPIATSLGNLVRIEKVDRVSNDEGGVSPAAGEVLYVLSFEGKKELPAPGMLPLVDPAGKESRPVFAGSPTKEGALTRKQWRYNGAMTAQDGKWIFEGTLLLPEPKVTLVYAVPTDAAGWLLKDGERKHRVF